MPSLSSSIFFIPKIVIAISVLKFNNTKGYIMWTPEYIRIVGNKLADKVAKHGALLSFDQSLP
jgi:hypothetical protein